MRISSLARKISKKPSELITFFEERGETLDSGAHTKLSDDQVESALKAFAYDQPEKSVEESDGAPTEPEKPEQLKQDLIETEPEMPEDPVAEEQIDKPSAEEVELQEEVEVIRAPKVTLPGLKVKGKIDLPEPKKKEPKEEKEKETRTNRNTDKNRKSRRKDNDYNPVAAARKRREEKEERERKAELKRKKKAKAQHYFKQQKKVAKVKKEKEDLQTDNETKELKRSEQVRGNIFQRFWKWFNS